MIFVTVGTHEAPFDRLVRAVERYARDHDEPIELQRGYSREPAPHTTVHGLLRPSEVERLVTQARIVVTHAGPASILLALAHGSIPVVVPRDPGWAEHIDDHQLAFGRRMSDRVLLVEDTDGLADALDHYDERIRGLRPPEETGRNADAFAKELGALVDSVVGSRQGRAHGLVESLLSLLPNGWGR